MRLLTHRGAMAAAIACSIGLTGLGGAAATAAPSPAPTAGPTRPTDAPVPTVPEKYRAQKLNWTLCDFDADLKKAVPGLNDTLCAMVTVPMDWNAPGAHPDIQVPIAYTKATGEAKGLVTSNPGGPSGPGLGLTQQLAADKPRLAAEYDLVSFDPRGFGRATHADCTTTYGELAALPTTPDPKRLDGNTFKVQEAEARLYAKACSSSELAPFINTQQTVYDMDLIRELLHATKLNYVGYSYGTWLGTWYADTYPQHTGRFILDSNMSWTEDFRTAATLQAPGFERRRDDMLFPWIARHNGEYGLGTTPLAVRAAYDETRAALAKRHEADPEAMPPAQLDYLTAGMLYRDANFPALATIIAALRKSTLAPNGPSPALVAQLRRNQGDVQRKNPQLGWRTRIAEARQGAWLDEPAPDTPVDLGPNATAVMCNDSRWSTDLSSYKAQWLALRAAYPFVGYAYGIDPCAFWPNSGHASRTIDLAGSPRLLMLQAEADPATQYRGAMTAHLRTLSTTRLVSVNDEGQHALWATGGSRCVDRIGDDFLFDGLVPTTDQVCGTVPLPTEQKVFPFAGPVIGGQHEGPRTA